MRKGKDCLRVFSVARIEEHNRNFQFVTRRVERTLDRLTSGTDEPDKESAIFEIRTKIRKRSEDRQKSLLIICDGDVSQWQELKKCTVEDYLIKLDNFVSRNVADDKRTNVLKNPTLLRNR